jgi:hypothetical protein
VAAGGLVEQQRSAGSAGRLAAICRMTNVAAAR